MLLGEELRGFLADISFATVCLEVDLGQGPEPVVLVKSTGSVVGALREAGAQVQLGCVAERTSAGPVLCIVVRAAHEGAGELIGEAFLDPLDDDDSTVLELLGRAEEVRVLLLDEELEVAWLCPLVWPELRRLQVQQLVDRVREWLEGCGAQYDFGTAREAFQEQVSLDELSRRAFSPWE